MARVLGISQPQIHNVLKGARKLKPELADRLMSKLEINLLDLFDAPELMEQLLAKTAAIDTPFPSTFQTHLRKPPAREQQSLRPSKSRTL